MKVISIMQPWATLIAIGEKNFETRSWKTNYRGELAIHAGKKIDKQTVLMLASEYPEIWHKISPLPTGCILATCRMADCWPIGEDYQSGMPVLYNGEGGQTIQISGTERKFGWYESGRYAWELMDVEPLENPIPAKGQLGIWNWEGQIHG